jgi:uncharacterized protein
MSRDYPDWINPIKAAQARREFAGSMALAKMARLRDVLAEPGDLEIDFQIAFGLDEHGQVRAEVRVSGTVPLVCQRTLRPYAHQVESRSVLGLVADEQAAEALPEDYEPLLVADGRIRLEDLVCEEILLGLPLVPRAPDSRPIGNGRPVEAETYKPFAGLAELAAKADVDPFKQE